jgi:hypothetical protein
MLSRRGHTPIPTYPLSQSLTRSLSLPIIRTHAHEDIWHAANHAGGTSAFGDRDYIRPHPHTGCHTTHKGTPTSHSLTHSWHQLSVGQRVGQSCTGCTLPNRRVTALPAIFGVDPAIARDPWIIAGGHPWTHKASTSAWVGSFANATVV